MVQGEERVGAHEHGNATCTTGRTTGRLFVEGNVGCYDDGVSPVPGPGLDPVYSVEESISSAVAGVNSVNTFNACVAGRLEEGCKNGLDGLGLVDQGFRAYFETTDGVGVNAVFPEEGGHGC